MHMYNYLIVSLLLIISSLLYIPIAKRFNIVDKPNHRSSHTKVTIRGGGIIFFIGALFFFLTTGLQYPFFFAGLTILAVVSFIDDLISLSALLRFSAQVIACLLLMYQSIDDYNLLFLLFLLIAAIAFVNAYNFMDGINGITGIYSIGVLCSLIYVDFYIIDYIEKDLLLYTLISIIIFGYFNFRKKAIFFAGDIGSVTLAFILVFAAYQLLIATDSPYVLLLFIVYGTDSLMTILKRFYLKEKLSEPHRHHIYQQLTDVKKIGHIKISVIYLVLQLIVSSVVITTFSYDLSVQWVITIITLIIFAGIYLTLNKMLMRSIQKEG
ncbi:UDP-N-acetylmuramyl pentapeptide phosphotransferase/UDP-N-acetylglucosamine-1-phosphate transferase [Nonlabens ulvanivorans]|uniref:UDP-N-acetylmuramyl pentapeptide phosphotransferase/UDP-N-acetylglucosamine-1-phosphate transferase n=2 Tax=Nonlabens ulvanivorans TaxID=906888 RepID=A0ABX5E477_NONUL|nr:UDP-N-acetylmuramyl pentapeptide phosphotransferase/UDP-N-acetylglucosamine-1-phosphate transferase [Nonlabens ulvanivorans]